MVTVTPHISDSGLPAGYASWRDSVVSRIESAKYNAVLKVNTDLLGLYWSIGKDILVKQKEHGWGTKVIGQLSRDLTARFPDDRGYSERNLRSMKVFASEYPDFPFCKFHLPN